MYKANIINDMSIWNTLMSLLGLQKDDDEEKDVPQMTNEQEAR